MKEFFQNIVDFIKGLMQPLLTVVAVFVFLSLAKSGYDPQKIFIVVVGVILFWFGYTTIKNFNFTNGSSPGNKTEPPKANGGQVNSTATAVNNTVSAVEEDEPVLSYEAFNEAVFDAAIVADVVKQRSVDNPATRFYLAWDRGIGQFNPKEPAWASYIKKLGNRYFSSIWGLTDGAGNLLETGAVEYADLHRNDDLGCTTCPRGVGCTYPDLEFKARQMGEGYYFALIEMQNLKHYLESA